MTAVPPADLAEIEAIKRLKYRYVRCLDLKRWDELEECLTEDAHAAYGGGQYSFSDRAGIMAFLRESLALESRRTSHHVHQPEIELTSPDTATATWALEDWVIDTEAGFTLHGAAFYRDEYVKIDGNWKIRRTGYERVYEEFGSRSG
jgi:hypothetical protein